MIVIGLEALGLWKLWEEKRDQAKDNKAIEDSLRTDIKGLKIEIGVLQSSEAAKEADLIDALARILESDAEIKRLEALSLDHYNDWKRADDEIAANEFTLNEAIAQRDEARAALSVFEASQPVKRKTAKKSAKH
jgi:hypothetical protein